jgi:predicted membrane protein
LEQYKNKRAYTFIFISVIFLILTAIAPSLEHMPIWTWIHLFTGYLFALFLTLGFFPFLLWVAKENPRLRRAVYNWFAIIWGGSITLFFIVGMSGVFEIFFFSLFIVFLLYLSLSLFEEQIIKRSVNLLQGHEDLNRGIEELFVPSFVQEIRRKSKQKKKEKKSQKEQ